MYKNENERFSEYFCYCLAKRLGIETVTYEIVGNYIRTKNFVTDKVNFEPMSSLMGEENGYNEVFNKLFSMSKALAKQYLKLIYFDTLVFNVDRHNKRMFKSKSNQS